MNINAVQQAYPEISIPDIQDFYSDKISLWKNVFENNPPWKKVKRSGLYKKDKRTMNMLNTAKIICDCFSDLTFSEQCEITLSDETYQSYVDKVLENNGFWENISEFISVAYALGGGVVKVFSESNQPKINFVHADKFLPSVWTGKQIAEGIFLTVTYKNKFYYTLIEMQKKGIVEYKLFKSSSVNQIGNPVELSELYNIPDSSNYKTEVPMFAYFKPAISNNVEYDTPLGISIFANAIDTIKALDIAFDSFAREFVLGKKRIIVPATAIQTVVEPSTGKLVRYFDADDEAFVALKSENDENMKITDNTIALRVEEHVSAINALLNILCFQVGLSAGTLSFDNVQGVKTATEVISQDSKTARTIKSNKNLLTETIETVINAVIAVGVYLNQLPKKKYTVTVGFKDNIVIDDNTLIENNIKLVQAGLKSKLSAIMEVLKCDEETAQKELEQIAKEQSVTGLDVDDFMNGGEDDDQTGDDAAQSGAE